MAGAATAAGVLSVLACVGLGVGAVGAATARSAHASGAADAAALAAADGASGFAPGVPCELAAEIARVNGASLLACDLDGLVASVRVQVGAGPFAAVARARAGPPDHVDRPRSADGSG